MTALGAAFIDSLDDATLRKLIDRAWPIIAERLPAAAPVPDGWLDSNGAAAYLSLSRHALHKLTAAGDIPHEQDGPGCKLWFKRSDLDAWRRGDWHRSRGANGASASKSLPNAPIRPSQLAPRPKRNPA